MHIFLGQDKSIVIYLVFLLHCYTHYSDMFNSLWGCFVMEWISKKMVRHRQQKRLAL